VANTIAFALFAIVEDSGIRMKRNRYDASAANTNIFAGLLLKEIASARICGIRGAF
jgi:hypothetical protein